MQLIKGYVAICRLQSRQRLHYHLLTTKPVRHFSTEVNTKKGRFWAAVTGFVLGSSIGTLAFFRNVVNCPENISVNCEPTVDGRKNSQRTDSRCRSFRDTDLNSLDEAKKKARYVLLRKKDEFGIPGLSVAVTIDGKTVWAEGLGFSDVENHVKCHDKTVMRIASISKPLTMVAVAKLWEEGKLDLDQPVQKYVPSFPEKTFNNEKVTITVRQVLSHLGGIRHYHDKDNKTAEKKNDAKEQTSGDKVSEKKDTKNEINNSVEKDGKVKKNDTMKKKKDGTEKKNDTEKKETWDDKFDEFYYKTNFKSVEESMKLFQDDPLTKKPGTTYQYTTFGYTLVSAVVEAAANEKFIPYMQKIFRELGLHHTGPDEYEPLVYNRARYYNRKNGKLMNTPYVDLSYKWAGGGFISNVHDLVQFGNAMLYGYQIDDHKQGDGDLKLLPGYLKSETLKEMWSIVKSAKYSKINNEYYGLGWVVGPETACHGFCRHQHHCIHHTGGAVGASSVLLIYPSALCLEDECSAIKTQKCTPPKGIVVAILVNLQGVGLKATAYEVAKLFDEANR
ncbi:serine beta-lactamase-like protein LACTB, mitochondrial [Saccoglossus kowalevskii]|uniref:Serine beta-lactamase-like protein LACTB, mitochondrial-like n=1 Tax=Saccoglossus kowalevskii TaxID=10224 RepID=A0ABM0GV82_SACKO|nr:PREDICTED: serine beta-lactamase-like protein LACTB, mitochondrial-like [Saccoglossus kowalevskii]